MTKQILLIEDDPDLAELISDYLSMNYYEVHHTLTAQEGLDLLEAKERDINLIVLDLMLPDMDGMQVCQKVRASKNVMINKVPIIMLTAKGDTTDRVLGLEMGADDYISKPFEPRELLARIRAVLRRHETPNQADTDSGSLSPNLHGCGQWVKMNAWLYLRYSSSNTSLKATNISSQALVWMG